MVGNIVGCVQKKFHGFMLISLCVFIFISAVETGGFESVALESKLCVY